MTPEEIALARAESSRRSRLLRAAADELDLHHRDFAAIVNYLDLHDDGKLPAAETLAMIRARVGGDWGAAVPTPSDNPLRVAERRVVLAANRFVAQEETDETWPALRDAVEAWRIVYEQQW